MICVIKLRQIIQTRAAYDDIFVTSNKTTNISEARIQIPLQKSWNLPEQEPISFKK